MLIQDIYGKCPVSSSLLNASLFPARVKRAIMETHDLTCLFWCTFTACLQEPLQST